jgi:hypothetical protein
MIAILKGRKCGNTIILNIKKSEAGLHEIQKRGSIDNA